MTILLVTGEPRVGKTTAVMRLAQILKEKGSKVGGIVSKEITNDNIRTGSNSLIFLRTRKQRLHLQAGKDQE